MDATLETSKLLVNAVQVMVPVLTGFLMVYAAGIGRLWEKRGTQLRAVDYGFVSAISVLGVLAFGCWALTLAGAIVSVSGAGGLLIPFGDGDALLAARISMGVGYWLFLAMLAASGWYFLHLNHCIRANR